jgi:hypothetical protein
MIVLLPVGGVAIQQSVVWAIYHPSHQSKETRDLPPRHLLQLDTPYVSNGHSFKGTCINIPSAYCLLVNVCEANGQRLGNIRLLS